MVPAIGGHDHVAIFAAPGALVIVGDSGTRQGRLDGLPQKASALLRRDQAAQDDKPIPRKRFLLRWGEGGARVDWHGLRRHGRILPTARAASRAGALGPSATPGPRLTVLVVHVERSGVGIALACRGVARGGRRVGAHVVAAGSIGREATSGGTTTASPGACSGAGWPLDNAACVLMAAPSAMPRQ